MSALPPSRRQEWEAERRYLSNRKQQIEQRLAELDEILRLLFPEVR